MQHVNAFATIATIAERTCKVRFDDLGGLVIDGLTMNEARLAMHVLETITKDKGLLVAVAQGRELVVADAPTPAPTMPTGAPNRAKWGPAEPARTPTADSPAGPGETVPDTAPDTPPTSPVTGSDAPGVPTPPETAPDAHDGAHEPVPEPETAPTDPADTGAECAHDTELPPAAEGDAPPVPDPTPETPPPAPSRRRKRGPKKPPPRVTEQQPAPEMLGRGMKHEGVGILDHKDHSDGGRLIIREDGWRVKLDADGNEVTRLEGTPPDISDVPTADTLVAQRDETGTTSEEVDAEPPASHGYPVPPEVLETRMTREVVKHLIDHGVTERDAIVAECVKLKAQGAKAFENSKDDEAVHRRVVSTLTVMGRG